MSEIAKKTVRSLLSTRDEKPFVVVNGNGNSTIILTCEHAGRAIPESLGDLGVNREVMECHIAYDIGVENVAKQLSALLDAPLVLKPYSRLVIDCNRPFNAPDSIPLSSDGTNINGNLALDDDSRQKRYDEIVQQFHEIVTHQIDQKLSAGLVPILISVHSFTPKLMVDGQLRPWHMGLLYNRDDRLATNLQKILNNQYPRLNIALNEPYSVSDADDYTIPVHGEQRSIPHVMLEINNSEIISLVGQMRWASILAGCIKEWLNIKNNMNISDITSREIPLVADQAALLFIDVQNFAVRLNGGEFDQISDEEIAGKYGYYFDALMNTAIPNMQKLQARFRQAEIEVMYTVIESLTADGRDRSLDYKITGFNVPKGSSDGQVIDELAVGGDEIILPKSSSSVFISTHIDYVLRNLGVRQLVICGLLTDQCVESAVRDACDLGYVVTLVTDACATYSQKRHDNSLNTISGYCRQLTTDQLLLEIEVNN